MQLRWESASGDRNPVGLQLLLQKDLASVETFRTIAKKPKRTKNKT